MSLLEYRAGARALARLRARGLTPEALRAYVLPATGPKWLVAAGFDRALLKGGWLAQRAQRLLLMGASAGAWRALALASPEPLRSYQALVERYCAQRFTQADDPHAISRAYRTLLHEVFADADLRHILAHPTLDLALTAVRARGPCGSGWRQLQALGLGMAALCNVATARSLRLFFERVVFHTPAEGAGAHRLLDNLAGIRRPLTEHNLRDVALASGSVPLYMAPIRDIAGSPRGAYLDGGLTDYHLGQRLAVRDGVVLLFLHQRRIIPGWMDKLLPWRVPVREALADVVLVHPSDAFVRSLPSGAVPTREDFHRFVDRPDARIAAWHRAVQQSEALGDAFLDDIASGAIAARVQPL